MSFNYIYSDILNWTSRKMTDSGEEDGCLYGCLSGAVWVMPHNEGYGVEKWR